MNPYRGCGPAFAFPIGDFLAILVVRAAAIDLGLGAAAFAAAAAGAGTVRRFPAHLDGSFTAESNREEEGAGTPGRERERERYVALTGEWGGVGIHCRRSS